MKNRPKQTNVNQMTSFSDINLAMVGL